MTRTKTLADIVVPWLATLDLPGGPLDEWPLRKTDSTDFILKGESHLYTKATGHRGRGPKADGDWVLTVRGTHVDVRHPEMGVEIVGWHSIEAADPEFFTKLERDLRLVIDYLMRS